MYKTGRSYIHELDGFGRKMPKVFIIYTISGLALMGVPGLCGFVSKWNLAKAAVESGTPLAYVGIAGLLVSALLTAIYMLTVSVRAFFPGKNFDYNTISDVQDPNWMMIVPLVLFVIAMFYFGLHATPVINALEAIAAAV
jgi:multicomponent Na+:H+ antiporter subunit D